MYALDLVIAVALGVVVGGGAPFAERPLAEGVLAFAVLILLQFVVTWLSVRPSVVTPAPARSPGLQDRGGGGEYGVPPRPSCLWAATTSS